MASAQVLYPQELVQKHLSNVEALRMRYIDLIPPTPLNKLSISHIFLNIAESVVLRDFHGYEGNKQVDKQNKM